MCGIFGLISLQGDGTIADVIEGLKKLEYRGYDSAGVGFKHRGSDLKLIKRAGKIKNLESAAATKVDATAPICIGHTRWATHGQPTERNAHPIQSGNFAVVMNGIIENFNDIKQELQGMNAVFETDTDTEVVAALLEHYYQQTSNIDESLTQTFDRLQGRFSYLVMNNIDDNIYCARNGAPMIIGRSHHNTSISSDSMALAGLSDSIYFVEDGQMLALQPDGGIKSWGQGAFIECELDFVEQQTFESDYDKGEFPHFMLKEIYQSSEVINKIVNEYHKNGNLFPNFPPALIEQIRLCERIVIVACGTSYNAGLCSKYIIEDQLGVECSVHVASEFRNQPLLYNKNSLTIFISQSGETADTLAALEYVKQHGYRTLALVNVPSSTIANTADYAINILAGVEIGVASTKAFVAQCACLLLFALKIGQERMCVSLDLVKRVIQDLLALDGYITSFLKDQSIVKIAEEMSAGSLFMFIGRGISYPLALEGALKFKEITYKMSEGLPAGELKHGPIALIDDATHVVAIAPNNDLIAKTLSNIHEVRSRKAKVVVLSTLENLQQSGKKTGEMFDHSILMPNVSDFTVPILYAIPLQLIAYYAANHLDLEIDQPRNLAKSVTVE